MLYKTEIAGYLVCYEFKYKETSCYFGRSIIETQSFDGEIIRIPDVSIIRYVKKNNCDYAYAEYMSALYITSNYLLRFGCCAFHSVAIRLNGKGYLISASSGVGKTTQYINLRHLYGDSIEIINGDKPFLEFRDNHKIMIHPSLWRGKENYGSDIQAELAGIIFLEQAVNDYIYKERAENAVVRSLGKFLYYPDNETTVRQVCELDRRLLQDVPILVFKNTGTLSSSEVLYRTLSDEDESL